MATQQKWPANIQYILYIVRIQWINYTAFEVIYAIQIIYSTCITKIKSDWTIRILIMLNHKLWNQFSFISFPRTSKYRKPSLTVSINSIILCDGNSYDAIIIYHIKRGNDYGPRIHPSLIEIIINIKCLRSVRKLFCTMQ